MLYHLMVPRLLEQISFLKVGQSHEELESGVFKGLSSGNCTRQLCNRSSFKEWTIRDIWADHTRYLKPEVPKPADMGMKISGSEVGLFRMQLSGIETRKR